MYLVNITRYSSSLGGLIAVSLFLLFAFAEFASSNRRGRDSDVRRLFVNFGMPLAGALLALLVPFGTSIAAQIAQTRHIGLFQHVAAPAALILASAILVRTFLAYVFHRAAHRWAWLWRIHRVHHSDTAFDLSLALRHHPFEQIIALLLYGAAGLALGLPLWAAVTADFLLLAASFWEHVDIAPPRWLGPMRHVLTSPDWHRVHHSAHRSETDSNFGSATILWDRLFGTHRRPRPGGPERIGLGPSEDRRATSILAQLASPFRRG